MHQSTCRLATVTCYSFHLVGKATDHTLPTVRPLLQKKCITRTRMMTRMATVYQGQVGYRHSQAQAIARTRMVTRMATVSPGSGRLLTFSSTCHYKGIKKLQKVKERRRLPITIRHLKQDDAFNRTWWSVLSIDELVTWQRLSIERTGGHVVSKASSCLRSLLMS